MKRYLRGLFFAAVAAALLYAGGCSRGCEHVWGKVPGSFDRYTGICTVCGEACTHDWNAKTGACRICKKYCEHTHGTSEDVPCGICGHTFQVKVTEDVIGARTEFAITPRTWDFECPQPGTIEKLEYDTDAYDDGTVYHKYVLVYLPYGYDETDASKKYNVVYFQHANGSTREIILTGRSKNVLDNMFYMSDIEPVIIVCTTFYMDDNLTLGYDVWSEANPQGFRFHREVIEDIIPAVESKYHTYTEQFDAEGLIRSRDHRAFTGFSRGGACTWNMIHYAFEYFRWWSPMSCTVTGDAETPFTDQQAFEHLKSAAEAHPDMKYFIFAASGGDEDIPAVRGQIRYFVSQDYFSYGKDPDQNNFFYLLSDYNHGNFAADYYYNSLQVFFTGNGT